jgi:hypothetical protein
MNLMITFPEEQRARRARIKRKWYFDLNTPQRAAVAAAAIGIVI